MKTIIIEPNSQERIKIGIGKVGFLWEVTPDKPIRCAIDNLPIKCGYFDPPYIVQNEVVLISTETTSVSYNMEIHDDIYEEEPPATSEKTQKEGEFVRTEPRRPKTGKIQNHSLNESDRWYEIKIPYNVLAWSLRLREEHDLLYSYEPNHANYATLPSGETLEEDTSPNKGINAIYVMCETAGVIVEFEIWIDGYY